MAPPPSNSPGAERHAHASAGRDTPAPQLTCLCWLLWRRSDRLDPDHPLRVGQPDADRRRGGVGRLAEGDGDRKQFRVAPRRSSYWPRRNLGSVPRSARHPTAFPVGGSRARYLTTASFRRIVGAERDRQTGTSDRFPADPGLGGRGGQFQATRRQATNVRCNFDGDVVPA
jgi:hypothetical protein